MKKIRFLLQISKGPLNVKGAGLHISSRVLVFEYDLSTYCDQLQTGLEFQGLSFFTIEFHCKGLKFCYF